MTTISNDETGSSRFSSNSEPNASELLDNLEDSFPQYYIHRNNSSHIGVLPVAKELIKIKEKRYFLHSPPPFLRLSSCIYRLFHADNDLIIDEWRLDSGQLYAVLQAKDPTPDRKELRRKINNRRRTQYSTGNQLVVMVWKF